MEVSKSDWKLFRTHIAKWQENYMECLLQEYVELLSGEENAMEKFLKLEERIKRDKKHLGVLIELRKSNIIYDIVSLINFGVITTSDLDEFSEELKEGVNFLLKRW